MGGFRLAGEAGSTYLSITPLVNAGCKVAAFSTRALPDRQAFYRALGYEPGAVVAAGQVHGDRVRVASRSDAGQTLDGTDAMITREPGILLAETFADCVPVWLYDPVRGAAGLAHAGWRGTVRGIAPKTLRTMIRAFGSRPSECLFAVGPSIGPCCYEVGEEVITALGQRYAYWEEYARPSRGGKWVLDLAALNARQLVEEGASPDGVVSSGLCTSCQAGLFFSYRRDGGIAGRMVGAIGL